MNSRLYIYFLLSAFILFSCNQNRQYETWSEYLGSSDKSHYTTLNQINKNNLKDLEIAWVYEAPDTGQMQMNPIIVDDILYGVTAGLNLFALDASNGEELWLYKDSEKAWHSTSRGLAYWERGEDKRLLFTIGKDLLALNAKNGELIKTFGNEGRVDLHTGLPEVAKDKSIMSNTPGTVYKDIIIMPTRVSEGADAAPGDIMAFNIIDGSLAWVFHPMPHPGEEGYDTWINKDAYRNQSSIGAGNNWAGMTVDEESGILFAPTGSFAPDFFGGGRPGNNLYSDCLLALKASTGELLWHYQLVHHDIWDRDPPAPPNLITIKRNGKKVKVVAQVTKQGYVYVFDRMSGEPLFDIEEVEVPKSNLEESSPTQPIPVLPKNFARRSDEISNNDYSPYAPNKEEIKLILASSNKEFYNPPDTTPTLILPGYDGAAEWGGAGVDPEKGIIYINSNEMGWIMQLEKFEVADDQKLTLGNSVYNSYCSTCHQKDLSGIVASGYPPLLDLEQKYSEVEINDIIKKGKGMMTGYAFLQETEMEALIAFLLGSEDKDTEISESSDLYPFPYKFMGYNKFLDANGLPALSPPWGTLCAIDLNTGEFQWQIPFGEIDSLVDLGYPITGTENYGGPIITQNGLLIIAATKDSKIRIFDRNNGELLWQDRLPASSFATPASYMAEGRQFIALACGGEKLGTKPGNKIIAYALRQDSH